MHKIAFYSIKCSGGREFCLTIQFSCPTVRCRVAYCHAISHFRANGKNRTHGSKATLHVPPSSVSILINPRRRPFSTRYTRYRCTIVHIFQTIPYMDALCPFSIYVPVWSFLEHFPAHGGGEGLSRGVSTSHQDLEIPIQRN